MPFTKKINNKKSDSPMVRLINVEPLYSVRVSPIKHGGNGKAVGGVVVCWCRVYH